MRISLKKVVGGAIAIIAFIVGTQAVVYAQNSLTTEKNQPAGEKIVSLQDLLDAGFTSPRTQPSTEDGSYPASVSYFWVGANAQKSPAKNLVMVSTMIVPLSVRNLFSYGTKQKDLLIPGGVGKEANLGGTRTAINFLKNKTYVVIIGPSVAETKALTSIVASKIQ